jgi:putative acetyltransferase
LFYPAKVRKRRKHVDITVRHSEPDDYREIHRIFSGPRAIAGTLQMPFPRPKMWRERLSEPPEGLYSLVACVEGEVVGSLGLETSPTRWRMRHVGSIGMAVRDDWQGKGVGTALMEAALDLADNWLNLTRIELRVFVDNAAGTAFLAESTSSGGTRQSGTGTAIHSLRGRATLLERVLYSRPFGVSTATRFCVLCDLLNHQIP